MEDDPGPNQNINNVWNQARRGQNRSQPENWRQANDQGRQNLPRHNNLQRGNQNRGQLNRLQRNVQNMNVHLGQRGQRPPLRGMHRNGAHGAVQNLDGIANENRIPDLRQNNHRGNRDPGQLNRNNRFMGFKALEDLALSDPFDIIAKVNEKKEAFLNLITKPVEPDMHILIIQILSKSCLSSFEDLKTRLLLEICNSEYLMYLKNYIMELPYAEQKKNKYYWNNQNDFWKNLIFFCETLVIKLPSVAKQKCRSLIEITSKIALEELNKGYEFVLAAENSTKLDEIRERILIEEKKIEDKKQSSRLISEYETCEPPEDFRQLSVIPKQEELLEERPYLRANVVRGGYRDVEHYLDIQFRLLREDCFGPLREGLLQYIKEPNKKKFDNMRVYRNVKFIGPYISKSKSGVLLQLDENTQKMQKKINWAHSKRFIFGSLLLFSKDGCQTFISATILDRDIQYLSQGVIPVSIVENANSLREENILQTNDSYVMFESEVYFEPYYHVLKALQNPSFAEHIAMSKYIVNVDPTPRPPQYLQYDTVFEVEIFESLDARFEVLQPHTWPSHKELALNESQFEAYKLALTHEFAVIQGPPGTGKTHLGVKVARTLLENLKSNENRRKCIMLIICYTNHALDQFLENILKITNSIVRIGGQSRNEAMEKISLNNLRKASTKQHFHANSLYHSERRNLNIMKGKLSTAQTQIESLSNGILTYDCMCEYVPQLDNYLRNYNSRSGEDKLLAWLLENANFQVNLNINEILKDYEEHLETIEDTDDRTSLELDDISEEIHEIDVNGIQVRTVFMLNEARHKIKLLAKHYKNTSNLREKNILVEEIRHLHYIRCIFEQMRHRYRERGESRPVRQRENLIQLQNFDRWCIYFTWANTAINVLREQIAPLQEDLNNAAATYEEARMNLDLQVLQNIKVVGMTTSGAARLRKLLTALAPPIVIVEEAAEVLEQHIVTSLTKHCKHLILIGDHQQLRPSAAYMKLARHYDIEVSLFERMIMNDMHSRRLGVQHRMRPEIAALISPHIYPSLENHPSVEAFPRVRGITSNVFFYTHDYKEDAIDDNASRTNAKEADMTLGLANYLMQQGYEAQDVTILAAYSGQMFYMRKQRPKYAFLDKIKITVVDNYQGEESKIILLSLVRNNTENKIGFLGTENRICVALSRAKEGFYIFGNIEILKRNSKLWTKIAKTLEDGGNIGNSFRLKCENHPDMISNISSLKDFEKVPEGGCQLLCNFKLSACGHPCPLICHGYDRGHSNLKCYLNCEREICELKHACPLKCFVKCEPCAKMVMKTLPCGHEMKVPCHRQPSDPAVKCLTIVSVTLPNCGHEAKKQCHLDMKYVACPVPCGARVERCGHTCRRRCHVIDDPDHEMYICEKACANAKRGCTANLVGDRGMHQCTKLCHETCDLCDVVVVKKRSNCKHSVRIECYKDADETECRKQCARMLSCGHFCKKKCFEPCGDCNEKVKKVIPECGHTVEVLCKITPKREMCQEKCSRQLSCRHICARRCSEPCSAAHCTQLMPDRFTSPCGHAVQLPCNVLHWRLSGEELKQKLLEWCQAACTATLKCTHACAGTCSGCQNGRLHAPCTHQCQATNICGHQCEEPCNEVCPPCRKQCEVKCPHSKCSKQCGAPCVPCQEKCTRQCRHGKCQRRCGEPCSRPPCDQPCDKNLSCGHRCRGLCGEPCPPICNLCSPDTFPRDFLGDEFEEDAKFIQLQDCNHILEVEDADNLMNDDKETITIRSCPFCRKPIINTYRYKDCVNEMYRAEINPIKALVYGTQEQVKEKRLELVHTCAKFKDMHAKAIQENEHFKKAFLKLQAVVKTENKMSLLQLKMHFLYIEILDMIGEKYEAYKKVTDTEFENLFLKQIRIICAVLIANIKKISQQQQGDISNEIKRMGSMIQLSEIFSHSAYKMNKSHPKVIEATKSAKNAVFSNHMYKEVVVLTALKKLQEEIKVSGIVTKEERDLIVKAIGFKQGHWFKCPNGHFYCIGECGGAMEISKCIECGAQIGGQSHALLGDNLHAPEMDGSRFAAWSQEYNNMANFDLNGL